MAELLRLAAARRILPDYAGNLLAAFRQIPEPGSQPPQGPEEALTRREMEVLRLLAAGLSNPEIAEILSIALSTVKTHTLRIYSKFKVHNRTQAVTQAQEWKLLP